MFHASLTFTAVALGAVLVAPAQGQTAPRAAADGGPASEAAALRGEALALYGSPRDMPRVVELRLEAARVAPLDDPLRVEDLYVAGAVLAGLGRLGDAQMHLEEAAATALAFGDLPRAAQAYLMAAVAAAGQGSTRRAEGLVAQADLLAHSALMPEKDCDCIRSWVALLTPDVASRIKD